MTCHMTTHATDLDEYQKHIRQLERKLRRSNSARREAEDLLHSKSRELAAARQDLAEIEERTMVRLEREKQTLIRAQYLAQVAIFQYDSDGLIVSSNNLKEVLGAAKDIVSIKQLIDMLHPLETMPVEAVLKHVQSGSYVDDQTMRDTRFLDHYGETRWLRWNISQNMEKSGPGEEAKVMTFGAVRNITQERQIERREKALRIISDRRLAQSEKLSKALHEKSSQLSERISELEALGIELNTARSEADEANKSKSRFLAMMSHDIRTPLNAIMAIFELLNASTSDPKQLELLRTASESGEQLLFLLADIILYARNDGWQVKPDIKAFRIQPFLENAVNSWRQLARKKSLPIQLVLAADLPEVIETDPVRLRQVIDNFLSNAIKYSEDGTISLNAEIKWGEERPRFQLSVYDEGTGIAEEKRGRIFQDFDRGGIHNVNDIEGSGLGLGICQRVTEALGGTIGVEPNVPHGSVFWIDYPVNIGDVSQLIEHSGADLATQQYFDRQYDLAILVAEDVKANQLVIGNMLANFGVRYDFADDGEAAVKKSVKGQYDAIFMDISMPKLNGMEATKAIIDAMGQNAPMIFAVTAFSSPDERDAIIASGMDGIVTKPISARAIEAVLRQIDSHGNIMAPLNVVKTNQTTIEDNLPIPDFEKVGVIETSRLDDMFGGMDKELQSRLLTAIESDLQNYFAQFEDAITKADKDNIAKTHHALKGLCSGFGAHALLAKLEAIRENPQSGTSAKLAEARESLQFTVQALHQFLLR